MAPRRSHYEEAKKTAALEQARADATVISELVCKHEMKVHRLRTALGDAVELVELFVDALSAIPVYQNTRQINAGTIARLREVLDGKESSNDR